MAEIENRMMLWVWALMSLFVFLMLADVMLTLGYMPYEANPFVLRMGPMLWVGVRMGVLVSCTMVGVVLFSMIPKCGLYFLGSLNGIMGPIVLNNVVVAVSHGIAF
ncbi:MAG: hypothetical protein ACXQT1_01735 [Methermicoccaceae archaeon]